METMENQKGTRYYCGRPGHRAGWVVLGIIGFAAFVFLFGALIMLLWNWLMPDLFHLGIISYWQAIGIAILGRLIFGSFHHGHHHHRMGRGGYWRRRYHGNNPDYCRDYSQGTKWNYYDQFWTDEGERAFNDYVKRKTGDQS